MKNDLFYNVCTVKIAIHHRAGSFSDRWITYCNENNVSYKLVNCYDSDIMARLDECTGLMWHWDQNDYKAALFAKQLTTSLEKKGMLVFPDIKTSWHYDDKVGQKYLLEAVHAPLVKSYVFYSRREALNWVDKTTFPKVFKLRGGAGSENVSLVKTKKSATRLVRKAFGKGFSSVNLFSRLKDRFRVLKRDKNMIAMRGVVSCIARMFIPTKIERFSHKEKGYIYFQDFIPGNDYDTRLIVIGDRCFGLRRNCRKGDFRASGSGILSYAPELLDKKFIQSAFDTAKKIKAQSVAFDFIWDNYNPKIIEISYCFPTGPFADNCKGYWDSHLNWHDKKVNPQYFMIEDFIKSITTLELSNSYSLNLSLT
jgi:glutathione synthase/RimK-type ligase-like ATP-grasp enzyme